MLLTMTKTVNIQVVALFHVFECCARSTDHVIDIYIEKTV